MKKVLLFPYDRESSTFVKYKDMLLPEYKLSKVVSIKGWGLVGDDAAKVYSGNKVGIAVEKEFYKNALLCDVIFLTNTWLDIDFKRDIIGNLSKIKNKDIECLRTLSQSQKKELKQLCRDNNNRLHFITDDKLNIIISKDIYDYSKLSKIETPVIFVMGCGEDCGKFDVQLKLREQFINNDYKVASVCSKQGTEIFGCHSIPKGLFNNNISNVKKVIGFNRYIKTIEMVEQPEVIIIGIPGGVTPITEYLHNDFGILEFIISQAVKPDYSILSLYLDDYTNNYFLNMSKSINEKYGININCFNISSTRINGETTIAKHELSIFFAQEKLVSNAVTKSECSDSLLIGIDCPRNSSTLFDDIVKNLSE